MRALLVAGVVRDEGGLAEGLVIPVHNDLTREPFRFDRASVALALELPTGVATGEQQDAQ